MSAALAETLPLSGYLTGSPGHASHAQNDLICALQARIAEALLAVHSGGVRALTKSWADHIW